MRTVSAPFPGVGVDTVAPLSLADCAALRARGVSFAVRYLGDLTSTELLGVLSSGLLLSLVTYADRWDGPSTVSQLRRLSVPAGATVWLDVESVGEGVEVAAVVNAWAGAVDAAGYQPGLYVGEGCRLTAAQLYALAVVRYWRSASLVPEPACGFCLEQCAPTIELAGVDVDVDYAHPDHEGRLAAFVSA